MNGNDVNAEIQMKWRCDPHSNLSNCEEARKNKGFSGLQRDLNPWPLHSRCSTLLPADL